MANAFYQPSTHSISICDEWIERLGETFDEQDANYEHLIVSAAAFTFAHEAGHALIDQLELGATGREEDVADQYAVYLLVGTDAGAEQVLSGATAFGLFAEQSAVERKRATERGEEPKEIVNWDSHSLDDQRFYNIICWAYGSDPERFGIVRRFLPADRAAGCKNEYEKMVRAFDGLLESHLR